MKLQFLIPNWRDAWKMFSNWAFVAIGLVQGAWKENLGDIATVLPAGYISKITIALAVVGLIGRIVKQPMVNTPTGPTNPPTA